MGLLTAAMGGAGEGLEKASTLAGGLYIKGDIEAEHQRLAQEAQAQREERNIRLTGAQARQTQAEKPEIIPAGSTIQRPGQTDFTAPIKTTPEELAMYTAHANYYNSLAKAARDKEPKNALPDVHVDKDENGAPIIIDKRTGARGTLVNASPGKEAVSHWYKPDEPAQPPTEDNIIWKLNGQRLPNGLGDIYPDLGKRFPEAAPGTGVMPKPTTRPPLADFFGGPKQTPAPAPARSMPVSTPQPTPVAPIAPAPVMPDSGTAVDAARSKLGAAQNKLRSYGLMQQRRDPQGFAAVQQEVQAAQRDVESATSAYQKDLGTVGAATRLPLRMK